MKIRWWSRGQWLKKRPAGENHTAIRYLSIGEGNGGVKLPLAFAALLAKRNTRGPTWNRPLARLAHVNVGPFAEVFVPNYLARVELHDVGDQEDYELLHTATEKRGLLRQIQGDDGVLYELPNATYVMQNTDITLTAAQDLAKAAAEETEFEYSLIVVEFDNTLWTNLEPLG